MDDSTRMVLFLAFGVILFLAIVILIGRSTDSPEDTERKRLENERQQLEIQKLRAEIDRLSNSTEHPS